MKKLLILLVFIPASAFAQDYPFRRNDAAQTPSASQNGVPIQAGVSPFREVYTADKPGFEACSASITGAGTPVPVIGATPNTQHIVTQVRCYNTSATPAAVTLKDAANTVTSDFVKAGDRTTILFPKPYRQLTNSALNASMSAGSATTCCANYTDSILATPTPTATATRTPTATP